MSYNTELQVVDRKLIDSGDLTALLKEPCLQKAVELLQQGEVVAFPTETVYGLGADALNPGAVARIFEAKGRPRDNPLIIHIAGEKGIEALVEKGLSPQGQRLITAFWPGPLTVVTRKSKEVPAVTTAGLDSVAIRMPSHPVARALIQLCQRPLAAPSANSSGYPSPTRAHHVLNDLQGKIPLIIDGGPCGVGVESTVVDIRDREVRILRPGGITEEELSRILGYTPRQAGNSREDETPVSPGLKYRHYSPATPLIIFNGQHQKRLKSFLARHREQKIAIIVCDQTSLPVTEFDLELIRMGSRDEPAVIAHRLFDLLRTVDNREFDLILIEKLSPAGLGKTIMNRLNKAAVDYI